MIRLVQRKLIIPRGDTGFFNIPALATTSQADVAVFTILDCRTKTRLFQKIVQPTGDILTFEFTHNDTVNLAPGRYVWDIKLYKNPQYADEQLIDGEEIDSYYAGFNMPECEIRETGDDFLVSPDAATGKLAPEELDIISAALTDMHTAVEQTETNVTHYPYVGEDNHWYVWDAITATFTDTGVKAIGQGVPAGGTTGQLLKKASAEDYDTEWADDIYATRADTILETTLSRGRKANTTVGTGSFAFGNDVEASGVLSHAEGHSTTASGHYSHAEGVQTIASGSRAHAEGEQTIASGMASHVEGNNTIANGAYSHVSGQYNIEDSYTSWPEWVASTEYTVGDKVKVTKVVDNETIITGYICKTANSDTEFTDANWTQDIYRNFAEIVGNGTSSARSNAYTLDWNGNAKYAGDVYVHANADSSGGDKVLVAADIAGKANSADLAAVATSGSYNDLNDKPTIPDIQINGSSIVDNGVANIPYASSSGPAGLLRYYPVVSTTGLAINSSDYGPYLSLFDGPTQLFKNGQYVIPVLTKNQHEATFYGLAKAAGDSTQSASENAVGTYTSEAKAAIQTMLDVPPTGALATKQDTLTFDSTPTAASTNPVTSTGIKDYVDTAVTNINTMRIHVCVNGEYDVSTGVPTIQNPDTQTFYLVPGGDSGNLYIEWVYVDNAWERFGSADIDLSGYALKTDTVLETTLSRDRKNNTTVGNASIAFGNLVEASGHYSQAVGSGATASGTASHAEGLATTASGVAAHAEGWIANASGDYSHAEGRNTTASGEYSHAEGHNTTASNSHAHAEGNGTVASGLSAHAEGSGAKAQGDFSHAEGRNTVANGEASHVSGSYNVEDSYVTWPEWVASTSYEVGDKVKVTATENNETTVTGYKCKTANSDVSFTASKWIKDVSMNYAEIVGNGTNFSARSNARALDWDGNEYLMGDVYVHTNADSSGGTKLATIADVPVQDVQINSTSIVDGNGVADIPIATENTLGVLKSWEAGGIGVNIGGQLYINKASSSAIKTGTNQYKAIVPYNQHEAAFYGLAKAAGDSTQSASANAVGTYTDSAKTSIRTMLGATSSDIVAVQDTQPTAADNKVWIMETAPSSVQVPTVAEMNSALANKVDDVQVDGSSIVSNGIATIPKMGTNELGIAQVNSTSYGIGVTQGRYLYIVAADNSLIKAGTNTCRTITPSVQDVSTFYGLAKASGDTSQASSSNAVGAYTDAAKASIQHMLGTDTIIAPNETDPFTSAHAIGELFTMNGKLYRAKTAIAAADAFTLGTNVEEVSVAGVMPHDVQVNGVSVLNQGVANVPVAGVDVLGVVKIPTNNNYNFGIAINESGQLYITPSAASQVKAGTNGYRPITPSIQDAAAFYGLAKAAGDTTQSSSSNAVGTYTSSAKNAIHSMLGTTDLIEVGFVETVTGTTPSITGQANYRYNCGELSTLSITPPSAGSIDVYFTSGSTATVLTVPNTVKWPAWFDATALEANTIYELLITDATYGSVMTWAAT